MRVVKKTDIAARITFGRWPVKTMANTGRMATGGKQYDATPSCNKKRSASGATRNNMAARMARALPQNHPLVASDRVVRRLGQ
jgi:hypothetical protein